MTRLYLIRHGETELNARGVYYGWTDCSLSSRGISQAKDIADSLRNVSFDAVVSSPLKRTKETAVIVSGFNEQDLFLDERLKELNFGAWEGKHYQAIQDSDRENWNLWVNDWIKASPPLGESFASLYRRVKQSIRDILARHDGKTVLLVSHQGCLRIIMCVLLNMKYEGYWRFTFEHGAYSLLDVEKGYCIVRKINHRPTRQ